MRVTDACGSALEPFLRQPFNLTTWRAYAEGLEAGLAELCLEDVKGYDYDTDIRPVVEAALAQPDKLVEVRENFRKATDGLEGRIEAILNARIDADCLLYLGLCSGAGWATTLNGRPAVLLGIEKIIELDWCDWQKLEGLITHELGHLWHFQQYKTPGFEASAPGLWQIYAEGVAMYFEQTLAGDGEYMHQYDDEWYAWCRENQRELFAEYLRRVQSAESVQDFFGDWSAYRGHSDVGYYLGAKLARRLTPNLLDATADDVRHALSELSK